jgi:hypothetical protein
MDKERANSNEGIIITPTGEEKDISRERIVSPTTGAIAFTSIEIMNKEKAIVLNSIEPSEKAIDKEGIITPTIGTTALDIINDIMLNDSVKNKTKIINDVNKIIEENIKIKNE